MPPHRRFLFAATLLIAALPAQASAHAILVESLPAIGGSLSGPVDAKLRFNSRIDRALSILTLIRADGSTAPLTIQDNTPPEIVGTRLNLPPGTYTLRWQVLAADGHITRGDIPFTVKGP